MTGPDRRLVDDDAASSRAACEGLRAQGGTRLPSFPRRLAGGERAGFTDLGVSVQLGRSREAS